MLNNKFQLPVENPDNYILNSKSYFSIIKPEQSINLVYNPEIVDLSGYSLVNFSTLASIALVNNSQHFGINSIYANLFQNDQVVYSLETGISSTAPYTFSLYVKGEGKFKLYFRNRTTGNIISSVSERQSYGFWHRLSHTIKPDINYANVDVVIELVTLRADIYLDGFQVEPKAYATTFISGNLSGYNTVEMPKPYFWVGAPNKSASVRLDTTKTGGKIVSLETINIQVLGFEGLGLPKFNHNAQELALSNKSYYKGSTINTRSFTLLCLINADTKQELLLSRNELSDLLSPTNKETQQPTKILFQLFNDKLPISEQYEIDALYNGGMEGSYNNLLSEKLSLDFVMFDPFIKSSKVTTNVVTAFSNLSTPLSLAYTNHPIFSNNNETGNWSLINNQFVDLNMTVVNDAFIGPDQNYYILGDGTLSGGFSHTMFRWDGSEWSQCGNDRLLGQMFEAVIGPDNKAYIVGNFTFATIPDTTINFIIFNFETDEFEYIARTDGPAYTVDIKNDNLVIAGNFTQVTLVGGASPISAASIAMFNITTGTWSTLGAGITFGINDAILSVKFSKDNKLWIGGKFVYEAIDQNILVYDFGLGTYSKPDRVTWSNAHNVSNCNSNDETFVSKIIITNNNTIYITGKFNSTGTLENDPPEIGAISYPISVAKWNGKTWENMQMLLIKQTPVLVPTIYTMEYDEINGLLYVGGEFNYAGPQFISPYNASVNPYTYNFQPNCNGLAIWNGSNWQSFPIAFEDDLRIYIKSIKLGGFYQSGMFLNGISTDPLSTFNTNNFGLGGAMNSGLFICCGLDSTSALTTSTYLPYVTNCNIIKGESINPIITIKGQGTLKWLKNKNGGAIYFNNKVLQIGEVLKIDLSGDVPTVFSNIYGNSKNIIKSNTSLNSFKLNFGNNYIEALIIPEVLESPPEIYLTYKNLYLSIDSITKAI